MIMYIFQSTQQKMSFVKKLMDLKKNRLIKHAIPFVALIVIGSFGFQEFTRNRYQFSKKKSINPQDLEKLGIAVKKPEEVTLDNLYEEVKMLNIEDWENIRGPRPWEENFSPERL